MNVLDNMKDINEVLQKELVLIIAKTHTCTVCSTTYDLLQRNVKDIDKVEIYNIYVDDVAEFRGEHTIFSVPTVLVFSEGKELLRESRFINYNKVQRLIEMFN